MPKNMCKSMRNVAKRRHSTVGTLLNASQPNGQVSAPLEDPREERFVTLYVENPNGTQAAIAAGYSPRSARTIASQLLRRRNIKDAIARRNTEIMAELDFTPGRIIREFAKIAGVNTADFITIDDETGQPHIDFRGVTRRHLAAVASVENTDRGVKYKTHDKIRALVELAKLSRMYPAERHEHTGADGGPIAVAAMHKIDIEALDHEQRAQLKQTLLMLTQRDQPQDE